MVGAREAVKNRSNSAGDRETVNNSRTRAEWAREPVSNRRNWRSQREVNNRSNSIGGAIKAANNSRSRAGGAREAVNNRSNSIGGSWRLLTTGATAYKGSEGC